MVTLFTKEPVKGLRKNRWMIQEYGYINSKDRKGLKVTLRTRAFVSQGLKLRIDRAAGKIFIIDRNQTVLWYWRINDLRLKINNFLIVFAESKGRGRDEMFLFDEALYFTGLRENDFLNLIDQGEIRVDLRMHLKPSGSVRNRGTAFRVKNLPELYDCYEKRKRLL